MITTIINLILNDFILNKTPLPSDSELRGWSEESWRLRGSNEGGCACVPKSGCPLCV